MTINARGAAGSFQFKLFQKNKLLSTKVLSPTEAGGNPREEKIKFNLVGDIKNYSFQATPLSIVNSIRSPGGVRIQKVKEGGQFVQKASVSISRLLNGVEGKFTKITGNFSLTIRLD